VSSGSPNEVDSERQRLLDRLLDRHPLAARGSENTFPLSSLGADDLAWLFQYESGSASEVSVPPLAHALLRRRADLQRAFPDPYGASREALAYWFATWGRAEYGLERSLVKEAVSTLPMGRRLRVHLWWLQHHARNLLERLSWLIRRAHEPPADDFTINVVGWIDSPTGVAQACRGTIESLAEADLSHEVTNLDELADLPSLVWAERYLRRCRLPIQLYHVNADMMDFVYRRLPCNESPLPHRVGYWFWELSQFPAELHWTYRFVDEVWCPSRFCFDSISEFAPVAVRWVPPGIPTPLPQPGARADFDIPIDSFLFFSSFDARSLAERKNPVGLVDAFAQLANRTDREVHLLFNVVHPEEAPSLVALLQEQTYRLPITLLSGGVSRLEYVSMLTACDAYISLHRSEGLGLPMIEAMSLGKPVIATNYGGCCDFLDETTGWPVDYDIVRIETRIGPYPAGAKWAEPRISDAVDKMLAVIESPEEVSTRCSSGGRRVAEIYSVPAAGQRLNQEIERLRHSRDRLATTQLT